MKVSIEMTELDLRPQVQSLLAETKEKIKIPIIVETTDAKVDYVRHDQAEHFLRGGKMIITLKNNQAADFLVTHELLHIQQFSENLPQLQFNLTSGDLDLDNKIMAAGLELYDTVMHFQVYAQQRKLGVVDQSLAEMFFQGLLATLKPEQKTADQWMVLRTLSILDGLVFFQGDEQVTAKLQKLYPQSTQAAQQMYQQLTTKKMIGPLAIRRGIVKLFQEFDQALTIWQLPAMQLNQFLTITPVLSSRQLKLQLRQLFALYHVDFKENLHNTPAYLGVYRQDDQNSFVLPTPTVEKPDEFFKAIYRLTVADFMKKYNFVYQKR